MNFEAIVTTAPDGVHVELKGVLDEEAALPTFGASAAGPLTIDLGGVRLINSLGCRMWVNWINGAAAWATEIRLERCSFSVVQQINVLGGFLPKRARVASFFVPYECGDCGHDARVLHRGPPDFDVDAVPDHLTCATCGEQMNLAVVRQAYFKFLGARTS